MNSPGNRMWFHNLSPADRRLWTNIYLERHQALMPVTRPDGLGDDEWVQLMRDRNEQISRETKERFDAARAPTWTLAEILGE